MHVIRARNVSEAWPRAIALLDELGERRDSRAGPVRALREPVTTVYSHPTECALLDPVRDSNPFFSVGEALWMLAGRSDAQWLDQFVADFSERFGEPGGDGHHRGEMHGAYGKRWRRHFYTNTSGGFLDQLNVIARILSVDRNDRQAVLAMWDPRADLGVPGLKDRPCNTHAYFRADGGVLDMTVLCRSNDVVMGCYGANAVHFSFLLQYMAARTGLPVGAYTQVSNNWHAYDADAAKMSYPSASVYRTQPRHSRLVDDSRAFDDDLDDFVRGRWARSPDWRNPFLSQTAIPMLQANTLRRAGDYDGAIGLARTIADDAWRTASFQWLERRALRARERAR